MSICVYLCSDEFIVSDCFKFGGIGMKMAICVYLCSDECIASDCASDCCKFGRIGMKMAICIYLCFIERIVSVYCKFFWDWDENGHLCLLVFL